MMVSKNFTVNPMQVENWVKHGINSSAGAKMDLENNLIFVGWGKHMNSFFGASNTSPCIFQLVVSCKSAAPSPSQMLRICMQADTLLIAEQLANEEFGHRAAWAPRLRRPSRGSNGP